MITPDFIGQIYKDTNTGNLWRANSLTPGDWTLEVQNTGMFWTPRTDAVMGVTKFGTENNYGSLPLDGIASLSFASGPQSIYVHEAQDLVSFSAPNTDLTSGEVHFHTCPVLASIDLSGATEVSGPFEIVSCPITSLTLTSMTFSYDYLSIGQTQLTSVSFPALIDIFGNISISNNANLTSIDLHDMTPANGKTYNFSSNALPAAQINALLARCVAQASYVSGSVVMNGGTNAAPTGQGVVDKATLIGRGVTVTTN